MYKKIKEFIKNDYIGLIALIIITIVGITSISKVCYDTGYNNVKKEIEIEQLVEKKKIENKIPVTEATDYEKIDLSFRGEHIITCLYTDKDGQEYRLFFDGVELINAVRVPYYNK